MPHPRPAGAMRAVLVLLPGLVLSACSPGSASSAPSSPTANTSTPVAHVGKLDIPESQFLLRMQSVSAAIDVAGGPQTSASAMERQLAAHIMQSLIMDSVIAQEAAARGFAATDADVQAQLAADAKGAGGEAQLETQLAQAGGSIDQRRDEIRASLNEQRVENAFASQRATALLSALQGGSDFATIARDNSDDDQSSANGGARGPEVIATLKSQNGTLAGALLALHPGQLAVTPAHDAAGYELLRLDGRTATTVTYHRVLIAAPEPYTAKERPGWFLTAIAQAIEQYCQLGEVAVYIANLPAPCVSSTPSPSASAIPPRSP